MSRSSPPPPCRDLLGPQPHRTTPSAGSDSLRLSFQGGSRPRHLLCCPLCCLNHPGTIQPCKFRLQSLPLTPPSFHPSPLPVRPQVTPPGPASSTPVDQQLRHGQTPCFPAPLRCLAHTRYSMNRTVSGQDPVPQALSWSLLSHGPLRSSAWSHAHFGLLTRSLADSLRAGAGAQGPPGHPQLPMLCFVCRQC